jgi:hypothetical protein
MKEICIVPTFQRNAYLYVALKHIRAQDGKLEIVVFSDRAEDNPELREIAGQWNAGLRIIPRHAYYGNSFCVLEALRWAYECGFEMIHVCEDDTVMHGDCLDWHRWIHGEFDDIFCSCGWIFNTYAPITFDEAFAPWFYAPNYAILRNKLKQVVAHANPLYYNDMRGYLLEQFPQSALHKGHLADNYFEQDALFQFCIERDRSQVAWRGIALVDHIGASGYNKPHGTKFTGTLGEQIAQIEDFLGDKYWRMSLFGRERVEREIGHELKPRMHRYRVRVGEEWESNFTSELVPKALPKVINSVPRTTAMEVVVE